MATYHTGNREELLTFFALRPDTAFTIDELSRALGFDESGKSTLYRLLAKFVSEGTVRKISDGKTRHFTYQYNCCTVLAGHVHLKCEVCGKMIHLGSAESRSITATLIRTAGFRLNEQNSLLLGICDVCQKQQRKVSILHDVP
ncbi:MAG: transcriptional repressor [Clostridia bacterium]|nr:transcriptional repressor [Clostridia bacterium]